MLLKRRGFSYIKRLECFNKFLYDKEWDSGDDIPLAMVRPNNSTKITDLLVQISAVVYFDDAIDDWLNDETDD